MSDAMEFRPPRERELGAVHDLVAAHCGSERAREIVAFDSLIAVERHTPVAAVHYCIEGDAAEIVYIVSVPKRRGAGRRLVEAACRLVASRGARRVRVAGNGGDERAHRFWSACGFAGDPRLERALGLV